MAVKRKKEKRALKEYLDKYAVKIKCCYCDLYDTCPGRPGKESSEELGITTRCAMTPNRRKKATDTNNIIPTFKEYFRNRKEYIQPKVDELYDRFTEPQRLASNS